MQIPKISRSQIPKISSLQIPKISSLQIPKISRSQHHTGTQGGTDMRGLSKASLALGGAVTLLGYAIVIVNIISLRKGRKIKKIMK